ncbi:MAG: hypothetical protein ABW185_13035 [Sedimenticola sp.]
MIDRTCLNTNIYDIGSVKSKPSAMPHEGSYRYRRLGVEEGIESRVDNAVTGTPMEIEYPSPTSDDDILSLTCPAEDEDTLLGKEERTHKSPSLPKPILAAMPCQYMCLREVYRVMRLNRVNLVTISINHVLSGMNKRKDGQTTHRLLVTFQCLNRLPAADILPEFEKSVPIKVTLSTP